MIDIEVQLGSRAITATSRPYVIAEIGVNHEGSLERAKELIYLAKEGRADAAKFQTYKAASLASKNSPSYWDLSAEPTESQYELFKKYDNFGESEYLELSKYCNEVGIDFLSTPFDAESIDFLDPLMAYYKIASADINNVPFLRQVGGKKKPVVLSTGASTLDEIKFAVGCLESSGCPSVVLLHCVLNYPTPNEFAHLGMIDSLKAAFPSHLIGYSDHTLPDATMRVLKSAVLLGSQVIEKHFTFDKTLQGNDHYHAMDVSDLKRFAEELDFLEEILGSDRQKKPLDSEAISRDNARRSIVLKTSIAAGRIITEEMITYKRPGTGISAADWDAVIGMRVCRDLEDDHVLQWEDLEAAANS